MKKCDQFKDLILTDYMDGELDQKLSQGLESHLLDCGDCRAFFKEVRNNTVISTGSYPVNVLRQPVPEELWGAIKQRIEQGNEATSPLSDLIEKLKGMIVFPKIVPVFASFILMFLVGSVTLNMVQVQRAKDKDQGEYLVALLSTGPSTDGDNNDVGTPIEHYFL
jgi:anti-sigma factor RsiW